MEQLSVIQQKLARDPIIRSLMPISAQFGIPQLQIVSGYLCLRYCPHTVAFRDESLFLYHPQISFSVSYPTLKLVHYSNLAFENNTYGKDNLYGYSINNYSRYRSGMIALTACYEKTLTSPVSEEAVRICQEQFDSFTDAMNITGMYKG